MISRFVSFLVMVLAIASASAQTTSDNYLLKHGDRLQISVWKDEALDREARVLPDGSISFPLVGRILVVGLSTAQVEKRIVDGLKPYIPDAVVSVVVTGTEGQQRLRDRESPEAGTGRIDQPGHDGAADPQPGRRPRSLRQRGRNHGRAKVTQ
jgi:hypothetical protein